MIVAHANHLASSGHSVTMAAQVCDSLFELTDEVRRVELPRLSKTGTLMTALAKHNYDVIIADIIPLALLLSFRNRSRIVYYAQDYDESYYSSKLMKVFIRALYFLSFRWRNVPTIAVSGALRDLMQGTFGCLPVVVENGVDLETFQRKPDRVLLGQKESRKAVLLLSRNDQRKGFDLARAVIDAVAASSPVPFEVWTVGEPPEPFPAATRHRHLGYLSPMELASAFSSSDLLLYPSRHEGFPLMVAEAFACGCPVVTTTAVPYAVHGENALVAAIEDVKALTGYVINLLVDAELAETLAAAGLQFARCHALEASLENFEAAIVASVTARRMLS